MTNLVTDDRCALDPVEVGGLRELADLLGTDTTMVVVVGAVVVLARYHRLEEVALGLPPELLAADGAQTLRTYRIGYDWAWDAAAVLAELYSCSAAEVTAGLNAALPRVAVQGPDQQSAEGVDLEF